MTNDGDRMARAGDYVLGLMSNDERERAERDLEIDPAFRDAVVVLAERMHVFDHDVPPETVPDGMWQQIATRIADLPQMRAGEAEQPAAVEQPDPPILFGRRRTDWEPARPPRRRPIARRSVAGWQSALMAACLLAACGIGYFAGRMATTTREPVMVVVLNTGEAVPGAVFEAFADDSVRILPLTDFAVAKGKIMQVWTLYDQAVGPVSLGTLRQSRETVLEGPDLPAPMQGQLYEITLEPAPGSPTGKPTGPILVKGFATKPAGV